MYLLLISENVSNFKYIYACDQVVRLRSIFSNGQTDTSCPCKVPSFGFTHTKISVFSCNMVAAVIDDPTLLSFLS